MFPDVKVSAGFVWCIAFFQVVSLPLIIIGVQNLTKWIVGRSLVMLEIAIAISVCAFVLLFPLSLFGLLPLGVYQQDYGVAAMVGGVLSVPLTRFVRVWPPTAAYFR